MDSLIRDFQYDKNDTKSSIMEKKINNCEQYKKTHMHSETELKS